MINDNNKIVSKEVMKELVSKIEEIINNYCYNLQYVTESDVDDFFQDSSQEITYYNSLIKDKIESKNFIWSSKNTAEKIANAIIEADNYADSLIKNISSIKLKYVISLPTSDISENTIYILKAVDSSSKDTLNLYNATDGWTSIGNFEISMDNYYNKTEINTLLNNKANDTEVLKPTDIKTDITATDLTNGQLLGAKVIKDGIDSKVDKNSIVSSVDSTSTNEQTVGAKLFYDNTNVVKCGRNVQLNVSALVFKQDMEGLLNLVVLNAIPEEYRPLTLTETTMYTTTGNISGRGFLDTNGVLYNFFYYDSTKGSPKIGGYLFGTFNYISAK